MKIYKYICLVFYRLPGSGFLVTLIFLTTLCSTASAIGLDEIINLAVKRDAQLRADTFAAEARNADGWKAVAGYGPRLFASGSYMRSWDISNPARGSELEERAVNFNEPGFTIGLEQPIIDIEKASIAQRGMIEMDIATLQKKKAREELLLRVHERYYAALSGQQNFELAITESAALKKQMDTASDKLELGFGTITDLYNAEARYSLSLAAEVSRKTELDYAMRALEEIIDLRLVTEVEDLAPDMVLPAIPFEISDWLEVALLNNSDFNFKLLQMKTAHQDYRAAQSRFLPALVLYADYSERHPDDGLLGFGEERSEMDVGLRLEINLLDGGRDMAASLAASKRKKAAREQVIVSKRSLNRSVRSLWESIASTRQLVGAYQQAAKANEKAMESTQASYDEGVKVLLDVLNAQQDYFRSLGQYKNSRYEYMLLVEKFRLVVGVEEVNGKALPNDKEGGISGSYSRRM